MAETRIRLDKQVQKATGANLFPLSDANGELQYADVIATIKTGETLTRLNSVEVVNGNLVIKYTPEDGVQQVVSTALSVNQTDINVADARMEQPSAGVYRLIISETDGSSYPVDLSALLATVTRNTPHVQINGNGTPANPLEVALTQAFWDRVAQNEATELFHNLVQGNSVSLSTAISEIIPQSIKVFRNGLRQDYGADYVFGQAIGSGDVIFSEPFVAAFPERVTVDYKPVNGMPQIPE